MPTIAPRKYFYSSLKWERASFDPSTLMLNRAVSIICGVKAFEALMSDSCCVAGRAPTDRSTLRLAPSCLTVITAPRILFCECIQIEYYISYNNTSYRSEEIKKKILEDNNYEQNDVIR